MKISVKPSEIHGLGCFATEDIAKGEVIGLYEGLMMQLEPDEEAPTIHFLYLEDEEMTMCRSCKRDHSHYGIQGTGLLRHINSTTGNDDLVPNVDMRRCWVVALRGIAEGKELLMDYEFGDDE